MMHDIQSIGVYAVTFTDEVTKNCNVYERHEGEDIFYDIVDVETSLGHTFFGGSEEPEFTIDNVNKTLTATEYGPQSDCLVEENLPYNYFQNSKLEAWKVWYCLDNDTARFAWADNSLDEDTPAYIIPSDIEEYRFYRDESEDVEGLYAWVHEGSGTHYTTNEIPSIDDPVFDNEGAPYRDGVVLSYTPAHEGTGLPNGRGVIYRLIDEWNNDCPYDFKNIQFVRPMTDGAYDPEGEDTFVYTSSSLDENENIIDNSLFKTDAPIIIYRLSVLAGDLPNNVFFDSNDIICKSSSSITVISTSGQIESSFNCVINMVPPVYLLGCSDLEVTDSSATVIYINNKKVLTEE